MYVQYTYVLYVQYVHVHIVLRVKLFWLSCLCRDCDVATSKMSNLIELKQLSEIHSLYVWFEFDCLTISDLIDGFFEAYRYTQNHFVITNTACFRAPWKVIGVSKFLNWQAITLSFGKFAAKTFIEWITEVPPPNYEIWPITIRKLEKLVLLIVLF